MPHTPGPWELHEANSTRKGHDVNLKSEANARLIAAAPELLAACKAGILEAQHSDGCRWWDANISELRTEKQIEANNAKCDCWLKAAREAIAKAEGN